MWIVQALQPAHGIIALVGHVRAQDVDEENMPEMFGHQCAAGSHLGQLARALAERPAQDGSKARTAQPTVLGCRRSEKSGIQPRPLHCGQGRKDADRSALICCMRSWIAFQSLAIGSAMCVSSRNAVMTAAVLQQPALSGPI